MSRLASDIAELEREHGLRFQRELDFGFVWAAHRWANGTRLSSVLTEADLSAGDFVRWIRQIMDLLDQIGDAVPPGSPLRDRTRQAISALDRGIIAYSALA